MTLPERDESAGSIAKSALITGASRGIGAAIARALAREGFGIWLNYRSDHGSAKMVKAEIESAGGSFRLLPFDVSDETAVDRALNALLDHDVPEVLVNNAGLARDGMMGLMSTSDWNRVVEVNLGGFFLVTRRLLPHMQRKRRGKIINISSTTGQSGQAGQVNYAAAKAGLIGATRALAKEVARRNIQVNAVAPGFIETEMVADLPLVKIIPMIPLGRIGLPEEVAKAVSFLCSPGADYITGQVISINGGIYL